MTSKHTIAIRLLKWTGIILAILFTLALLATWFLNQEPFQKKIRERITRQTHDVFKFRQMSIALLPRPHVVVDTVMVKAPGKVMGSVASAVIYPELLPLLTGKFSIARVRLDSPELTVKFLEEPGAGPEDAQAAFAETRAGIESAMTAIHGFAPDLVVETAAGKIIIESDRHVLSKLDNINGSIALLRKGFNIRLRADAARWGRVSINGALYVWRHSIAVRNLSLSGARSSLSGLNVRFSWRKTPYLDIRSGQGVIALEDVHERREMFTFLRDRLRNVKKMTGIVRFTEMNFVGPLLHEEQWKMQTAGMIDKLFIDSPVLVGPVRIRQGRFQATTDTVILTETQASVLDSSVSGVASFVGPYNRPRSLAVSVDGRIGLKTMDWASKKIKLPARYVVRSPLWLSRVHFTWEQGEAMSLSGTVALDRGPRFSVDLRRSPGDLLIKRLMVEDEKERALLTMRSTAKTLDIRFKGRLDENTIRKIFERTSVEQGRIQGDFRAHIVYDSPGESSAYGTLEAMDLVIPAAIRPSLTIQHIILAADNRTVSVSKGSVIWEGTPLEAKGRINAGREGFQINMNVNAGSVTIEGIRHSVAPAQREGQAAGGSMAEEKSRTRVPVLGAITFDAKDFTYGRYILSPFQGTVFLDRNSVRVEVADTTICGVRLTGHFQPLNGKILLDMEPAARGQQLEPALRCFSPNNHVTGTFDLTGKLHTLAQSGDMVRSLQGHIEFAARDGKIYRYPILARIFAFLNLTELLRGKLPDLGRDGFKYKSIKVKGDISNGKLLLGQATVEGATLNIAAEGEIDFGSNKIDITVLVAPFKTIEYILSRIPLLRNILANKLVTIPVRVSGDLNDPDVTPLDPRAIGQTLLDIMKGVLELPFKVIEPLFGGR